MSCLPALCKAVPRHYSCSLWTFIFLKMARLVIKGIFGDPSNFLKDLLVENGCLVSFKRGKGRIGETGIFLSKYSPVDKLVERRIGQDKMEESSQQAGWAPPTIHQVVNWSLSHHKPSRRWPVIQWRSSKSPMGKFEFVDQFLNFGNENNFYMLLHSKILY